MNLGYLLGKNLHTPEVNKNFYLLFLTFSFVSVFTAQFPLMALCCFIWHKFLIPLYSMRLGLQS